LRGQSAKKKLLKEAQSPARRTRGGAEEREKSEVQERGTKNKQPGRGEPLDLALECH